MSAQQMTAGENNICLYQGEVDAYTAYLVNGQATQPQQQQAQMDPVADHRNMIAFMQQQQKKHLFFAEAEMHKKQKNEYDYWQAAAANSCTP